MCKEDLSGHGEAHGVWTSSEGGEDPERHYSQVVEPGGDHEGRPRGGGLSEHWTGGVSQVAEVETTKLSRSVLSCTYCH